MSNKIGFGRDVADFLSKHGLGEKSDASNAYGCRITALAPAGGDKVIVRIIISNPAGREEQEFVLLKAHAEDIGLSIGEIEDEMIGEIEYFASVAKAYNSACASFAYTPSSYSALYKKLLTKGFPKDVSSDAIDALRAAGFVDESDIALRRAQIFVAKRWGRTRIMLKLREEGFGDECLQLTRDYLEKTDFIAICTEQIRKKYGAIPSDAHERQLMYASLSRMGFSSTDVREALKSLTSKTN